MSKSLTLACAGLFALTLAASAIAQAPRAVSRAEFIKTLDVRFNAADSNHDGRMSKSEVLAAQQRDLRMGRQNLTQQFAAKFKQLDTNKDGQLNLAEFSAAMPNIQPAASADQIIAKLDTNRNGSISADEYRAPELAGFAKADANRDGIVTPAEMNAANGRK